VFIGSRFVGVTPVILKLPRRGAGLILRKNGFAPAQVSVTRRLSEWIYSDVALSMVPLADAGGGGSPGDIPKEIAVGITLTAGLDLLLGGAYNLEPTVSVVLAPAPP
jgi:hypothetical protein